MPLTWRNVDTPDFSASNQLLAKSGDTLAASIAGIGGAMKGYRADQVDQWSKAAMAKAQGITDLASFDAAVADGSIYAGRSPGDLNDNTTAFIASQRAALQDQANKDAALALAASNSSGGGGGSRGGGSGRGRGSQETQYIPAEFDEKGNLIEGTGIAVPVSGGGNNGGSNSGNSGSRSNRGSTSGRNYMAEADVQAQLGDAQMEIDSLDPESPTYREDRAAINARIRGIRNLAVSVGNAEGVADANAPLAAASKEDAALAATARETANNQEGFDLIRKAYPNGATQAQVTALLAGMSPEDQKKYKGLKGADPTTFGLDAYLPEAPDGTVDTGTVTAGEVLGRIQSNTPAKALSPTVGSTLANLPLQMGNGQTAPAVPGGGPGAMLSGVGQTPLSFGSKVPAMPEQRNGAPLSFGPTVPEIVSDQARSAQDAERYSALAGVAPDSVFMPSAIAARVSAQRVEAEAALRDSPVAAMRTNLSAFKDDNGGNLSEESVSKKVYDNLGLSTADDWTEMDFRQHIKDIAKQYDVDFNTTASAIMASGKYAVNDWTPGSALDYFGGSPIANYYDTKGLDNLLKGYSDPAKINKRNETEALITSVNKEYDALVKAAKKAGTRLDAARAAVDADPKGKHNGAYVEAYKQALDLQDQIQNFDYANRVSVAIDPAKAKAAAAAKAAAEKAAADGSPGANEGSGNAPAPGMVLGRFGGQAAAMQGMAKQAALASSLSGSPLGGPAGQNQNPGQVLLSNNPNVRQGVAPLPANQIPFNAAWDTAPLPQPGQRLGGGGYTAPLMEQSAKDFSTNKKVVGDILQQKPSQISLPEYMKLTPAQRVSKKLPANFQGSAQQWRNLIARL